MSANGVGPHSVSPVQDTHLWSNVKKFVQKTHYMIETLTNEEEGSKVASWMKDGKTFVIKNKSELVSRFKKFGFEKMKKYDSFVKQLYNYNFRKVTCVGQANSIDSKAEFFTHPQFQRNNPAEMVTIVDRRNKESPKRENETVLSEETVNKVARLEGRVEELGTQMDSLNKRMEEMIPKMDLLCNKIQELSDYLLPNASNVRVCPNMDEDCPNPETNTVNDGLSYLDLLDEFLSELVDEHTDSAANISTSFSPLALPDDIEPYHNMPN